MGFMYLLSYHLISYLVLCGAEKKQDGAAARDLASSLQSLFNGKNGNGGLLEIFKPKFDCEKAGADYLRQRQAGCFEKMQLFEGPLNKLVLKAIMDPIATHLKKCECENNQEQVNNIFGSIGNILRGNISHIFNGLKQDCRSQAERQICTEMVKEVDNQGCNVCRFLKLAMNSDDLNNCVCEHFETKTLLSPALLHEVIGQCVAKETVQTVALNLLGFRC